MLVLITFLSGVFLVPNSFADSKERDEIIKFIKQKKARWSAKDTKISRFTKAERKKRLGSQIPTQTIQEKILAITSAPVPSQLDWRNYNGNSYVTPVKEQSECSDCWAFASTAALESNKLISGNTPGVFLDLSEQTLNSCSGAGSCSGGYIDAAANFLRDIGLPLEACNPYTATDGMCSVSCSDWLINPYKISGWYKVNPAVEAIKYALYNYGPVVALMAVNTDYYYYSTGVYEYSWGSFEGYHAVLVVGYDDAEQCFIIKSSWGEDWGEAGYGKIAYSEVAGNSQFGFWTIAYENAIPTGFPTQDNIPRDPNNPNTTTQNGNSNEQLSILTGSVKDESGNTVSGAEIKIDKYKATSNAAGSYVFSSLPAGSYIATVSKKGYSTLSANLTVTAKETVTKNFVIYSSGTGDKSNDKKDDSEEIQDEVYGPGWINVRGEHVTLEKAGKFFKARKEKMLAEASEKAPLAGAAADYETDEIKELAYALRYDPKLIYEYVHNNIDYVPYFGSVKGAQLTYLDGSGNDFDQASLMIALLRASSGKNANQTIYTAEYVFKFLNIPADNLANWFRVPKSKVAFVLNGGFVPYATNNGGQSYLMARAYVKLIVNGQDYFFDPAYKTYNNYDNDNKSPMSTSDFGTAMEYDRNAFLNVALSGATVEPNGYLLSAKTS
ncbi:peptidase c1a, papain [hydrocarbon metagenome]|uniref:Peptidase c1a, papain n=1 Tax=hydrocarbon metagenome TaxID=938273 RepID=A0A0W8FRG9_9ZZZZ